MKKWKGLERNRGYWINEKESREARLVRLYNMTGQDFLTLLNAQNGRCGLCGEKFVGGYKAMQVDHCHDTGHVRGILHRGCNQMLGHAKDSIPRLMRAILYLERKEPLVGSQGNTMKGWTKRKKLNIADNQADTDEGIDIKTEIC